MGLTVFHTSDERRVGAGVEQLLREALARAKGSNALVLAPSLSVSLEAQRALEQAGGLAMGVDCATINTWCELRWALYGDGRTLVKHPMRAVLMELVLAQASREGTLAPLDAGAGTVQLLCEAAQRGLPWMPKHATDALTAGESRAVELLERYGRVLERRGLVEPAEAAAKLPALMAEEGVALPPCVLIGFGELPRATREFALAYATAGECALLCQAPEGPAGDVVHAAVELLEGEADSRDIPVKLAHETAAAPLGRAPELNALLSSLFDAGEEGLVPTGAVSLLEPAGPLAVAESVCGHVCGLARGGASRVVVVTQDVAAAWRGLAPKLHAHGLTVRAQLTCPASETRAGAGFMGLASSVAALDRLAVSWPAEAGAELPDMTWWPPREVSDFLLRDVSGVGAERAWRRDVAWRGNRILTPAEVLRVLQNHSATSPQVAGAVRELLRGHFAAAATRLATVPEPEAKATADGAEAPMPPVPSAEECLAAQLDEAALRALAEAGRTLRACGVSADDGATLEELVKLAGTALERIRVTCRPELVCEGSACTVEIMAPSAAASLAPASADAVVYLGLDSATSSIPEPDSALDRLLEHCGIDAPADGLARARASFASVVAAAREHLSLVRPSHDASASETFPAVMLSELVSCYACGEDDKPLLVSLPESRVDEGRIEENLSATGVAPQPCAVAAAAPAGQLDPALRRLVVVPRDGQQELPHRRPSLSASQVETYLECPYKWLTLRRLGLDDCDAEFSNMQVGTFVHRVLELTHRDLFLDAARERGLVGQECGESPEGGLFWFDPAIRVAGSRVDEQTLERAKKLMHERFAEHLAHQRLEGSTRNKQALVPHTPSERRRLSEVEHDIETALEYEASRFTGFEPRLFEGRFGGSTGLPANYAGADFVGTIDRIDVDAEGRALVIDYKHKSRLFDEYALLGRDGADWDAGFALPGRVQTLIYASIARELLRDTDVELVGAVYLGTKGVHEIAGALTARDASAVLGSDASEKRIERVCVPVPGARTFDELLDRTEEAISGVIERMLAGEVDARPSSPKACAWCPVLNCERRQS